MSPRESPEVSWEEKEVDTFTGDKEVLTSGTTEPASDIEAELEDSEDARSEVGDMEAGVKPYSEK